MTKIQRLLCDATAASLPRQLRRALDRHRKAGEKASRAMAEFNEAQRALDRAIENDTAPRKHVRAARRTPRK